MISTWVQNWMGGGTPPPPPFIADVETHGWLVNLINTPTTEVIDFAVPVTRSGYLGTTSLTSWTENVLVHRRAPVPGSSPRTYSGNRAVMARHIFAGDTVNGVAPSSQLSTRQPPPLEGFWTCNFAGPVGDTFTATSTWECALARHGLPVTLVRYTVSSLDGGPTVEANVLAPVARLHSLTNLYSHEWRAVMDLSSIPDGHRVHFRMRAYGPYGQTFDSDTFNTQPEILSGRGSRRGLKHNGIATNPVKVVLRDTASATPGAALSYSTAYANCYARTSGGINAARTAAQALNQITYGVNGLDGVEFYIGGTSIAATFNPSSLTVLYSGIVIRSDPTDFPGGGDFFTNFTPGFTGHLEAAPHNIYGITFRDFARTRRTVSAGGATDDFIAGTITGAVALWIIGGEHDCRTPNSSGAFFTNMAGVCTLDGVTVTNNIGGAGNYTGVISGAVARFVRWIGSRAVEVAGGIQEIASPLKIGSRFERPRMRLLDVPTSSWAHNSHIMDGCEIINHNPTAGGNMFQAPDSTQKPNTRGFYCRNTLFENCSFAAGDRGGFPADGSTATSSNVWFRNCTAVGYDLAGRWNAYYNQLTAASESMFQFCGFDGCIMPRSANKGDREPPADGGRYVGWAEHGTSVGGGGNWWQWQNDPVDRRDSYGVGSNVLPTGGTWNNPGFVDYKGSDGVSLGLGYGNYNLTAGAAARGGVSYIPSCRFDARGNALPVNSLHTTPGYLAATPA